VFVNDPDRFLTKAESLYVETCEKLSQEFNGQFLRVNGTNIAKAIGEVAKQYPITQIAIGESQHSRWKLPLRGSLTQQLVRSLKHVDLHIIATEKSGLSN
jgi:two-component system sensor histidine kinase KdpD